MAEPLEYGTFAAGRPYHAAYVTAAGGLLHGHRDFWELMYVVDGDGVHHIGGRTEPLTAYDLVLVGPKDVHEPVATDGLAFVNVAFPAPTWQRALALADVTTVARRTTASGLEPAFHQALVAYEAGASALDLFALLAAVLPELASAEPYADAQPPWLRDACAAFAADEASIAAGLPRLTALANVSPGHLARTMRRFLGCAPVDYVDQLRLQRAAVLLRTTDEPVGRIARRCGYASESYFNRRFRRRHGEPPGAFRRREQRAVVPAR